MTKTIRAATRVVTPITAIACVVPVNSSSCCHNSNALHTPNITTVKILVVATPTNWNRIIVVIILPKNDPIVEKNRISHADFPFDDSGRSWVRSGSVCAAIPSGIMNNTNAVTKRENVYAHVRYNINSKINSCAQNVTTAYQIPLAKSNPAKIVLIRSGVLEAATRPPK